MTFWTRCGAVPVCPGMEVDVQSTLSLLRTRAAKTPDRLVLNDIGGAAYSYDAFCREALRCADALERLAYNPMALAL